MTMEGPDPKTFGSWEEAFQYPIATVRNMERQLRSDIDSNKERLRSLVGSSYRDLLGTAETIIEMDSQIKSVETFMGEMGKQCNSRLLNNKMSNSVRWDASIRATDQERFAFASQLAVLRSCPIVLSKLLKTGESLLLAAKILVLSRLLHKKLSSRTKPPPYLASIMNRLANFRRKLLLKIDNRFRSLEITRDVLVEAMCAFSLATTSSPTDVLRHYHHIQLEAIMQKDLPNAKTGETIVHALEIYIKAMKDTRSYFPEQLSQALQSVKSAPLFRSAELHSMIELNLDVYGQFIDDDIKMFVPYIRHDELQKLESERILKKWAKQAFSSFLSRLQTQLATIIDPLDVMQLRTNVVQQWLSTSQRSVGIDSLEVLDGLRGTFNSHLVTMVQSQITSLSRASSIINNRLLNWENGNPQPHTSLWDISMISMDFSNGANIFIESILTRFDGKDEDLRQFLTEYEGWLRRVANIEQMLKNMRENKWDDSADDFDNNDDTLDNKQILLCEDDPLFLQDKFQTALEFSLSKFESMIQTQSVRDNGLSDGQKAVYLLRICRESMKRLPLGYRKADFGLESVSNLHETVAILAIEGPLNICKRRIKRTRKNRQALGRPLWEGDPALPVLPSSWVFRLLHDIVSSMKTLGRDLWSLQAVKVLKKHLRLQLAAELQLPAPFAPSATQLNGDVITERDRENLELGNGEEDTTAKNPENATNGELNVSISDVSSNDSKIQRFFDIVYLTHSTKQKEVLENDVDDLDNVKNSIQEDLNLEVGPKRRMLRDAEEYWRRTSMLFALIT